MVFQVATEDYLGMTLSNGFSALLWLFIPFMLTVQLKHIL